ncbi:hypothetical protein D3C86_1485500 [compost metagenome]
MRLSTIDRTKKKTATIVAKINTAINIRVATIAFLLGCLCVLGIYSILPYIWTNVLLCMYDVNENKTSEKVLSIVLAIGMAYRIKLEQYCLIDKVRILPLRP